MIALETLQGVTGVLREYEDVARNREVDGEHSLSFRSYQTPYNTAFGLLVEECKVSYDGEEYTVKKIKEYMEGYARVKEVECEQYAIGIIDERTYTTIGNGKRKTATLKEVCDFISASTKKYSLFYPQDMATISKEVGTDFGNDNLLSLIDNVCELWALEREQKGKSIYLSKKIGPSTQFQVRYGHNIQALVFESDTNDLKTYIRGYGKKDEKKKSQVTAEYTSPNAAIFGIRHAEPFNDERFTTSATLLTELPKHLQDVPAITFDVEFEELQKAGLDGMTPVLGMEFWLIHEPLGIDIRARVVAIEDYPESNKSAKITITTRKKTLTALLVKREKQARRLDRVITADGKIRAEAITGFMDLDQSAISLFDDTDPLKEIRIGKLENGMRGISTTTNGGTTWTNKLTF